MAKFLNTTGVSYHLEELMATTKERLILISPYLQFNERIKEHIQNLNIQKRDIRIIYREDNLKKEESNWLKSQQGIRLSYCKNLHAKCYINENEAIITSMNLYEFSQLNNNEMGVYLSRKQDADFYNSTMEEAQRLLTISNEIRLTPEKTMVSKQVKPTNQYGYCIRTGVKIPFNIEKPMCYEAFKEWNKYGNPDYMEKFCHFTGEMSKGETSIGKPILKKNWKKAQGIFNF